MGRIKPGQAYRTVHSSFCMSDAEYEMLRTLCMTYNLIEGALIRKVIKDAYDALICTKFLDLNLLKEVEQ